MTEIPSTVECSRELSRLYEERIHDHRYRADAIRTDPGRRGLAVDIWTAA
jgi:hypothetical protein